MPKQAREEPTPIKLLAGQRQWPRFAKYRVVRDQTGNPYIAPAKNTPFDYYRPFDYSDQLLMEFLTTAQLLESGKEQHRGADWENIWAHDAERIVRFCNRWGLLGLFWHEIVRPYQDIHLQGKELRSMVLLEPQFLKGEFSPGMIDYEKYAALFFPGQKQLPNISSAIYRKESFLRGYSEPVAFMASAFHQLRYVMEDWDRFRRGDYSPESRFRCPNGRIGPEGDTWGAHLTSVTYTWPLGEGVYFWRKHKKGLKAPRQLDYYFKSLFTGVSIMFTRSVVADRIRLCGNEHCLPEPFIPTNPDHKYCSTRCGNAVRQRNWWRNKGKKQKSKKQRRK